ncbi:hypothetical protein [Actinomadura atramentaria]|uniref:hypothetical protein n=1 Tax=Actinomadura atramentaria TaxID=1990 RepID=UPI001F0A7D8F|nr:hypothetical protein [Actinomadura atramentaria]
MSGDRRYACDLRAEQDRNALAYLVEYDADPFEVELYELAANPQRCCPTAPSEVAPGSTSETSGG